MTTIDRRIPQIPDLKKAIRIYYSVIELTPKDIKNLFDCCGTTATRLKKIAMEYIIENEIVRWNAKAVNTKAAFRAWGLDIDDLEKRYNKLKKLEATP